MEKSNKGLSRDMRRKLKKKRKDYIRSERESVRRQNRALKQKTRERRRKMIRESGGYLKYYLRKIFPAWQNKTKPYFTENSIRRNDEKNIRKEFLKQQKNKVKRDEQRLQKHQNQVNRRLRKERNEYYRKKIIEFLRNPFRRKKLKKEHELLRKQIREDMKRERREYIQNLPSRLSGNISRKARIRKTRFRYTLKRFQDSLGQFGKFLQITHTRNDDLKTLVNSTILFVIAFIFMYYINHMITILTARMFDIPAVLYSYRIFWPLYTYSSLYTRLALVVIFAMGPLFSIALAIIFYRLYLWFYKFNKNFKSLFVWIIFHGINLFFGAYVSGVITRTGFVYTTEWLFYSNVFDVEEIIFLIVSVAALVITGYYLTRQFLTTAITQRVIEPDIRIYFILSQVVLPWLFGSGILILINYPSNPPELLVMYAVSLLMIAPVFAAYRTPSNQRIKIPGARKKVKPGWIYIVILFLLVIFIRGFLYQGISFN